MGGQPTFTIRNLPPPIILPTEEHQEGEESNPEQNPNEEGGTNEGPENIPIDQQEPDTPSSCGSRTRGPNVRLPPTPGEDRRPLIMFHVEKFIGKDPSRDITSILKSYFNGPWANWQLIPKQTREEMWKKFGEAYNAGMLVKYGQDLSTHPEFDVDIWMKACGDADKKRKIYGCLGLVIRENGVVFNTSGTPYTYGGTNTNNPLMELVEERLLNIEERFANSTIALKNEVDQLKENVEGYKKQLKKAKKKNMTA